MTTTRIPGQTGIETRPDLTPQQAVNAWNLRYPVGTEVDLILPSGRRWPTTTRSAARVYDGRPVVVLDGWPGAWTVGTDIQPIESTVGGAA